MNAFASALYEGRVTHRRLRPRRHLLAYRVFWLLLDLDEIDAVARRTWLFSRNRFNAFSFFDRDYGEGCEEPLRAQMDRRLLDAGLDCAGGTIRLLTMPRVLGYAFNPLSVYFCSRRDGSLAAIVYEVNNTFGQRHSYLAPVEGPGDRLIRQRCEKQFYVSPFMDMALSYEFRVAPPAERVRVSISCEDADGPVVCAALTGRRVELRDRALARLFVCCPLLTLKVIAGIHWEAMIMWLKGLRLRKRPASPTRPVTIVRTSARSHDA